MNAPHRALAEEMLCQAEAKNPGPWAGHSRAAAEAAFRIASKCPGMDAEAAYAAGLLHDIGRREGYSHIRHIFDGYDYLMALGFEDAARVCLTHSFQIKDVDTYFGDQDVPAGRMAFLRAFLARTEYDDVDRLIQLCDCLALPGGYTLMEKRMVDVAMRHGTPACTLDKWRATFAIKARFDALAGVNVYTLLPGIVENTFGF